MTLCRMDYNQIIDQNIRTYHEHVHEYPTLQRAATPLARPSAPILGREMGEIRKKLHNPEKANIALLGEPGTGKTAVMQGFAYNENSTQYLVLSVDVERLVSSDGDKDTEMARGLQDLARETSEYTRTHNVIVILFMDEFHRIVMVSEAAVEALKPILEKSAYNGFRIVAATTFEEYERWITPNRALDQRLLRMTLPELARAQVIKILQSRAEMYGVADQAEDGIYDQIYDTSKRILISNAQPRASIDMLNNMIGEIVSREYMEDGKLYREYSTCEQLNIPGDKVLSRPILNRVVKGAFGIDIDHRVSAKDLERALKTRIFDQDYAVYSVMNRFKIMMAGFAQPNRPSGSMLLTGPTGTGKTELVNVIAETLNRPLERIDMSSYPNPEDATLFLDDIAYAGAKSPNGIILIDEIEKATKQAINVLLQVLDAARLKVRKSNKVVSFTGNVIFMTTNVGSDIYQHLQQHAQKDNEGKIDAKHVDLQLIYQALRSDTRFEQAVLGRINNVIPFMGLSPSTLKKIAHRELMNSVSITETAKRRVLASDDILEYIIEDHTSEDVESGGARDARRNMENIVIQEMANYLAEEPDEVPFIIYIGGKPRFSNQEVLDKWSGTVEIQECHPMEQVDAWLRQLEMKTGRKFNNHGLFIPNDWTAQKFVQQVAEVYKKGSVDIKTFVSGKTIWIDDIKEGEKRIEQIKTTWHARKG